MFYKENDTPTVQKLNATASGWEIVGDLSSSNSGGGGDEGFGDESPMVIAFNGTVPYVTYLEGDYKKKMQVKQFDGTSWKTIGDSGFSAGGTNGISIASDGTYPYVAYRDGTESGKITVQKRNGAAWEAVGATGFSAGDGYGPANIIFNGITPYVAYSDNSKGGKLIVQRYNSINQTWETVGTNPISSGVASGKIAFDGNIPYVVYIDEGSQGRANVKKFNTSTNDWELVGDANFSGKYSNYPDITFNENVPYIVLADNAIYQKIIVKKLNGNIWETVDNTDFSGKYSTNSNIAFNNGNVYIAYSNGGTSKATVRKYNTVNEKWDLVSAVLPDSGSDYLKLIFVNNVPYLSYLDGSSVLTVKKLNGNVWETVGNASISASATGSAGITSTGKELVVAYAAENEGAYAKSFLLPTLPVAASATVYVSENGAGLEDGSSWTNATSDLQKAIQQSTENVYVAAGTYKPIYPANTDFSGAYTPDEGNQDNAFVLRNDIKIFGGFNANAPEANTSLRDTSATSLNKSILSGDFNGDDINLEDIILGDGSSMSGFSENTFHVLSSVGSVGNAQLNGFTITSGYAVDTDNNASITVNGEDIPKGFGGGLICFPSSPVLNNLIFTKNIGFIGGGIMNYQGEPVLKNVRLNGNTSAGGGGMANISGNAILTNVTMIGNIGQGGAGLYNAGSNPVLTNTTITDNSDGNGNISGIYNASLSNPIIRNSIINGIFNDESTSTISYSIITESGGSGINWVAETGIDGGNNLDVNPMFTQPSTTTNAPFADGDYTLQSNSAAINAGSDLFYVEGQTPDLNGISTDLAGKPRFNGAVDMGAYEYEGTLPVNLTSFTAKAETAGTKLTWQTASEQNNKSFTVSRSIDGGNFTTVGNVASKGNSSSYTFLDQSPSVGTNYYRLQQIDIDGKITDLGVRSVVFQLANIEVSVYPNPTADLVSVKFATSAFNHASLVDLSGKVLEQQVLTAEQNETQFDLSNYKSGSYIIRLTGQKESSSHKVIKL